jgi:hypothetical protein
MNTIVLHGVITPERKLEVELPEDTPIGAVEVEIRPAEESSTLGALLATGAVGSWANRTDIEDSVEFARELPKRAFPRDEA